MTLTFCDTNKKLIKKVAQLFEQYEDNKTGWTLKISKYNDVFKEQKKNGGLICTASNPGFYMDGGLDLKLKNHFHIIEENIKEFQATKDIFPIITVDKTCHSNRDIIRRALCGIFAYRYKYDFILTGIGTAIGGLDEEIFLEELERILNANLCYANLINANLYSANLSYANLANTNLSDANLRYADLYGAHLAGANLTHVSLYKTNVSEADFSNANLYSANLSYANLANTNLSDANLSYADLQYANLRGANLADADISNVHYNEHTAFFALQCPEEGAFIGWKKCADNKIVKLKIEAKAKRSSATSRKCRCSSAKVLAIYNIGDETPLSNTIAHSIYDKNFKYEVGKIVKVKHFNPNRWNECSFGIHFFLTRKEAELYK